MRRVDVLERTTVAAASGPAPARGQAPRRVRAQADLGRLLAKAELQRRRAESELYRMEAELLFDRVAVESAWRALDLSCGPLGVLDILAERVGPQGMVIGMDDDPEVLDAAAAELAARGVSGVGLARGDVADTGGSPQSFDLVHARLALGDRERPRDAVAEMVRLTRAGGWVALQDADLRSWTCEPACPAWDRLVGALTETWPGDPYLGGRLPSLLRATGVTDVEVDAHVGLWQPGVAHRDVLPHLVTLGRGRIVAAGLMADEEIDVCLDQVRGHLARADTLVLSWTLFQAWGRRPYPG